MSQTEVSPCGAAAGAGATAASSAPLPSSAAPASPSLPGSQRVFQEAVRAGNTAALQALLQGMSSCEFNVNAFGPEGQTALHQSVIEGNLELVKLLVKFGADARLANRDGWSALHIAAFGGHQDIVLYLVTRAKYACAGRGPPEEQQQQGEEQPPRGRGLEVRQNPPVVLPRPLLAPQPIGMQYLGRRAKQDPLRHAPF